MVSDRVRLGDDYYIPADDGYYKKEEPQQAPPSSKVDPSYYKRWKIEPIRFCMDNDLPFWLGSVIKYIMRYDQKNGIEDLKKAKAYIDFKIKELENADGR